MLSNWDKYAEERLTVAMNAVIFGGVNLLFLIFIYI